MQYKEFLSIYDINYIKFKDGGKNKMKLDKFIGMMTGHFDNKEQFDIMQKAGKYILMQNTSILYVMIK